MFAFATVLLVACNPQESALEDLRSFTDRLEIHYQNYSAADWDDAVMHYGEICETLEQYRNEYTPEQHKEIGRLKGRCMAIFTKHEVEDGINGFMQNLYQYKGMFDGFMEGLNGAIEDYK